MQRFSFQHWFFDDTYVGQVLYKLQNELGKDKLAVYDIRMIREQMSRYLDSIPQIISEKSGIPRKSCLGTMIDPIPLNRIPLLTQYQHHVTLESRDGTNHSTSSLSVAMSSPTQNTADTKDLHSHNKSLFETRR